MSKILDWIKKFLRRLGVTKPDVKIDVFDCEFCYPYLYDDSRYETFEPEGTCKVRRTIVDGVVSQVVCRLYDPEGDKCSSVRNGTKKCVAVGGVREG